MKNMKWLFCSLLLMATLTGSASAQVVLAVPARHDLVNLGFDFVSMFPRSLDLVCYSETGAAMVLERFDHFAGRWVKMTPADWASATEGELVLVGEGTTATKLKMEAARTAQCVIVDGHRLHEVANAVNGFLRLSPAQWKSLAYTYNFKLLDRNVEERRYGRYGPPRDHAVQRVVLPLDAPIPSRAEWDALVTPGAFAEPVSAAAEEEKSLPVDQTFTPRLPVDQTDVRIPKPLAQPEAAVPVQTEALVVAPDATRPEDK